MQRRLIVALLALSVCKPLSANPLEAMICLHHCSACNVIDRAPDALPADQYPDWDHVVWIRSPHTLVACNASVSGELKGCGGSRMWRLDDQTVTWNPQEVVPACHLLDVRLDAELRACLAAALAPERSVECLNDSRQQ